MSGYLYPRCEQETLELYKDCLIYREGRAEFFLLLFLVFLRSTCRHSRARERNGTSMGVAGRLLKGLADDVGRGVKWVGADVVFSFSRVETFVPPPLLLILRSSLPAKHDQSLFPATTPSLSLLLHPPPAVRQRRLPLRYFLLSPSRWWWRLSREIAHESRVTCAPRGSRLYLLLPLPSFENNGFREWNTITLSYIYILYIYIFYKLNIFII